MILKQYSKMALVAVAASVLMLSGCGGKKDDVAMSSHAAKPSSEMSASTNTKTNENTQPATNMVAKPATNSVYFDFDSAAIKDAGKMVVAEYAAWLKANQGVSVIVEGNCDERGSREYNLALGEERAKAVKAELVADGVNASRIDTVSYGEERPVCTRSGEACWAQNRRGDIVSR